MRSRPAVSATILNEKREVLLTKRSRLVIEPFTWCLPGGHLEGGSTWEEAIRKEVHEEVGLEIINMELCGVYSDRENFLFQTGVEAVHFIVANFRVQRFSGNVHINEESDAFGWFTLDHLPSNMMRSEPPKILDAFQFNGTVFVR